MGLNHPESIELWREWERSRHRARRAKHTVSSVARTMLRRGGASPSVSAQREAGWALLSRTGERRERILLAVDSASPTSLASVMSFVPYLRLGVDVLAPASLVLPGLDGQGWTRREMPEAMPLVRDVAPSAVLSIGHHLPAGKAAHAYALERSVPQFVVQHGALTPFAPPLPHESVLLAWSDADAAFFTDGRSDVETLTVGSQLLWQAAHEETIVDPAAAPVFLGQMHGAELSRRLTAGAAYRFCREHGASYRPHPSEVDAISRAAHRLMQRRGIAFADTSVPLRRMGAPVVGIFSTGVLEAAVRGVPAWVYCPGAPLWVLEFWHRYRMHRFGGDPTPAPDMTAGEPAAAIAKHLEETL